jgi:hypothetical protein
MAGGRAPTGRRLARPRAAPTAAAGLYLLIGVGVLSIGTARSGTTPDLLAFGAMAGGTFGVVAALLLRFRSRVLWAAVAVLQVTVIGAYFAMAEIRTPPIELWGLLVKGCQLVVLLAVGMLLLRDRPRR